MNKTISCLVVAISVFMIFLVAMFLMGNESNRKSHILSVAELDLQDCESRSWASYENEWDNQCKTSGIDQKTKNCLLPNYIADGLDEMYQNSLDRCTSVYNATIQLAK